MTTGKRNIKDGSRYNHLISLSGVQGNEVTLIEDGGVEQTIAQMKKIVRDTLSQTARLAPTLKGTTRLDTARNIWNFLYNHVQYKKDHPLREQLRQPARTWKDRVSGVDCDCYSIFISSVLTNLGIPHSFRIAAYGGDYQHVYVVVPDGGTNIVIDPVASSFNREVSYTKKKDFPAMNNSRVSPLGDYRGAYPSDRGAYLGACPTKPTDSNPLVYLDTETINASGYVWTADVLKEMGVPHQAVIDETNTPKIQAANTLLPTTITYEKAKALKQTLTRIPDTIAQGMEQTDKTLWVAVALALVFGLLISSNSKKSTAAGVAGLKKSTARSNYILKL